MAFRNPVHSLPADRITGQITGPQIKAGAITAAHLTADAIDGKVITGATVRTSATYPRVQLDPDGNLYFYPAAGVDPARVLVDGSSGAMQIIGPNAGGLEYGLTLQNAFGSTSATIDTDEVNIVGNASIGGLFSAGNLAWGSVNITPVANVDTSLTVSGVGLVSVGSYRVWLNALSGVPSSVKGLTANNASADGFTLWINRTVSTTTTVWWLMLAK